MREGDAVCAIFMPCWSLVLLLKGCTPPQLGAILLRLRGHKSPAAAPLLATALRPATPGDQILTGLLARAIYDKTPHFTLQFNAKVAIYLHLTAMIWPGGESPEPRPEPVTVPER